MAMPAALSVGASRALSSAGSSRTSFRWPFSFIHSRTAKLDWRPLSSLDLDRVEREVDLDALESHLEGIAFGALGAEEMRWLDDEAIRKLYRVMQMIIQYLLYVRLSLCTHPSTHCAPILSLRESSITTFPYFHSLCTTVEPISATLAECVACVSHTRPRDFLGARRRPAGATKQHFSVSS